MCWICDELAPTCGVCDADNLDDYFHDVMPRARSTFRTPSHENFVLSLLKPWQRQALLKAKEPSVKSVPSRPRKDRSGTPLPNPVEPSPTTRSHSTALSRATPALHR